MKTRAMRFGGVVLFQFVLLFGVIGFKQYTIWTGTTVTLQTVPVDPRSPFSGSYIHLRYSISQLKTDTLRGDNHQGNDPFYPGNTIYVELAKGKGQDWHAVAAWHSFHSVALHDALIRGTVDSNSSDGAAAVIVKYGIEDVYLPEGTAQRIGDNPGPLAVQVKVDRFGNALAEHLITR
ncbi:MAG TPA: GDYXXLXY domain-containing protein [Chloroflexota bacterium]